MRTRCQHCATVFRISAEQLRARNGMVRCGQCQAVFNAFDGLIDEAPPPVAVAPAVASLRPADVLAPPAKAADMTSPQLPLEIPAVPEAGPEQIAETSNSVEMASVSKDLLVQVDVAPDTTAAEIELALDSVAQADLVPASAELQPNPDETTEESLRAAREAGIAAVRELSDASDYNRWAAGTLGGNPSTELMIEGRRPLWPFITALTLLAVVLVAQLAAHFRGDLVQRMPGLADTYAAFGVEIPLARQVDLVTIETSDLQSDSARGLLVLQATLKNRAPYAQEWPLLELTLTDANDAVVSRRVLKAAEYLPAKSDAQAFAANSEIGLKLWLESKFPAAGYRLYVFYP